MCEESGRLYSILADFLPKYRRFARGRILRGAYDAVMRALASEGPPIRTRVHGRRVLVNRGNPYPFFVQRISTFNAPLVELVHRVAATNGRPARIVDVGAAFGDTVLLLHEKCADSVGGVICIEGDSQFYDLLLKNTREFDNVVVVNAMVGATGGEVRSLVKHHAGTAAAIGAGTVQSTTLDKIEAVNREPVDILKIDVDGFDGEVLLGAKDTLRRDKPAVIFEWHPKLIERTGTKFDSAFNQLADCGYTRYSWFRNRGTFSHHTATCSGNYLQEWYDYLISVNDRFDEHFDIIAQHSESSVSDADLWRLEYARKFLSEDEKRESY